MLYQLYVIQFYQNFLFPQFVSDAWCGWHGEDPVKKRIHLFIFSFSTYLLRSAWHFCRYWGYSSEQNKVLALLHLGARERQKKSQSVKFIVISWYVSEEEEGYSSRGSCLFGR